MKKTDNFFIISNYNQDPRYLLEYCNDYLICDQSEDTYIKNKLKGTNFIETQHTGHNITDYFGFFIDNYNSLPEFMALIKGNIIGRHVSKEFFERVYDNKYYTFLYNDRESWDKIKKDVFFLSKENEFLDVNNSWYVPYHPHKYFSNFNSLLTFIYKDPLIPEYCCFAPGGCYIISKYQVLKNLKEFYVNLNKIMSYTLEPNFPSEAHQIERMLHIIYSSNYEVNEYMNDEKEFDKVIEKRQVMEEEIENKKRAFLVRVKRKGKRMLLYLSEKI